jgi:hypothetical protein
MTEEKYRTLKLVILASFVVGTLTIGADLARSARRLAENGRFVQYDRQKDTMATANSTQTFPTKIIDTRTGAMLSN